MRNDAPRGSNPSPQSGSLQSGCPQPPPSWHAQSAEATAAQLGVDPAVGLGVQEALARRVRFGANALLGAAEPSALRVFAAQWKSPLILVLAGAAGLAAAVGHPKDAIVIMTVVLANAVLGYVHERRAARSLSALRELLAARAIVRRDGARVELLAAELVPGDVLLVSAGDRIAADGRLLQAHDLELDESMLTGESVPVRKRADVIHAPTVALQERGQTMF